jgi:hypothetical protein
VACGSCREAVEMKHIAGLGFHDLRHYAITEPAESQTSDRPRMLLERMVGTTRFELATSPTPRVRSTRLSHVPTCYDCRSRLAGPAAGVAPVYIKESLSQRPRQHSFAHNARSCGRRCAHAPASARERRIPWGDRRRSRRRTRSSARRGTPAPHGSRAAGGTR